MTDWSVERLTAARGPFSLGPIDLTLNGAGVVAVLGPSGAGKTTLLRVLAGLLPATWGSVRRDGVDLTHAPPERRGVGYVPQGLGLFESRSVRANVAYPLRIRNEAWVGPVTGLLERFGLTAFADRRPTTLSGGERQRVAMARALASRPKLLLWDEPLAALDVGARAELIEGLREIVREESVPLLVVTHDPAVAFSLTEEVLLLDAGRPLHWGRVGPLYDRPPTAFAARFLGFENVLSPGAIDPLPSPLRRQLGDRAGTGGVCFPASALRWSTSDAGSSEAKIQQVVRRPGAFRVLLEVGGARLEGTHDGSTGLAPTVGASGRVELDVAMVRPVGGP